MNVELQEAYDNLTDARNSKMDQAISVSDMVEKQIRLRAKIDQLDKDLVSVNSGINNALSALRVSIENYIYWEEKVEKLSQLAPPPDEKKGSVTIHGEDEHGNKISEEIPIGKTSKQVFSKVDQP